MPMQSGIMESLLGSHQLLASHQSHLLVLEDTDAKAIEEKVLRT